MPRRSNSIPWRRSKKGLRGRKEGSDANKPSTQQFFFLPPEAKSQSAHRLPESRGGNREKGICKRVQGGIIGGSGGWTRDVLGSSSWEGLLSGRQGGKKAEAGERNRIIGQKKKLKTAAQRFSGLLPWVDIDRVYHGGSDPGSKEGEGKGKGG